MENERGSFGSGCPHRHWNCSCSSWTDLGGSAICMSYTILDENLDGTKMLPEGVPSKIVLIPEGFDDI